MNIQAWIFDVDGTLIDSNDAHARAWYDAFLRADIGVNYDVVRSLIGMGGDKIIPRLTGQKSDSKIGQKISKLREQIYRQDCLPQVKAFPKTRELFQTLHSDGLRLYVASSAPKEELNAAIEIAGVQKYIDSSVSAEDVAASKPSPDVVCAALRVSGLDPAAVRMIGDTPYDVEGAALAGLRTLGVRSGGWNDNFLIGALRVFEDVADILHCREREGSVISSPEDTRA